MKYIKLFESFNDFSNIKNDIIILKKDARDMFVELTDEGYKIYWYSANTQIRIYKFLGFDLNHVKEYILMFNDYMEERFNDINFYYKIQNIYQEETLIPSYEYLENVKEEIVSLSILIEI